MVGGKGRRAHKGTGRKAHTGKKRSTDRVIAEERQPSPRPTRSDVVQAIQAATNLDELKVALLALADLVD